MMEDSNFISDYCALRDENAVESVLEQDATTYRCGPRNEASKRMAKRDIGKP